MDSREWMSDDPCDVCACGPKRDPQAFDGCEVFNTCVQHGVRIGGIAAQKKLLRYLIFTRNYDYYIGNAGLITIASLIEMLEQLEETNG